MSKQQCGCDSNSFYDLLFHLFKSINEYKFLFIITLCLCAYLVTRRMQTIKTYTIDFTDTNDVGDEDVDVLDLWSSIKQNLDNHCNTITSFLCHHIRIGNYCSTNRNPYVHFHPRGIMFNAPSIRTSIRVECVIPIQYIQHIYQNRYGGAFFLVLLDSRGASIVNDVFDFDCPIAKKKMLKYDILSGLENKFISFTMANEDISHRVSTLMPYYRPKLRDISGKGLTESLYRKANSLDEIVTVPDSESDSSDEMEIESIHEKSLDVICLDDSDSTSSHSEPPILTTMFSYPAGINSNKISISVKDLSCLEPETWLNDSIIDFWSRYIYWELITADSRKRSHIFSSFFYQSLRKYFKARSPSSTSVENDSQCDSAVYSKTVASWLKGVDIFSKDFLFFPISHSSHWVLVVVCFPALVGVNSYKRKSSTVAKKSQSKRVRLVAYYEDSDESLEESNSDNSSEENEIQNFSPCMFMMDSMLHTPDIHVIFPIIRKFLQSEWTLRRKTSEPKSFTEEEIPGYFLKVPLQSNSSDCGIYILKFIEMFFKKPIKRYQPPFPNLADWFSYIEASKLRLKILATISDYMKKHYPENVHLMPT